MRYPTFKNSNFVTSYKPYLIKYGIRIDSDGVQLWKKKAEGGGVNLLKRYMEVNASQEDCLKFFGDTASLQKVNDRLVANEVVEEWDKCTRLMRREMKGNFVVSNRDLALFWQRIKLKDGSIITIMYSIENR